MNFIPDLYPNEYLSINATESPNTVIREWRSYKREDMAKFVVSMNESIKHQQKEFTKPVIELSSSRYMSNPLYAKFVRMGLVMLKF